MRYIVFDLEWNSTFQNGKLYSQEITEIGAVEVSEVDGILVIGRQFHSFVRPLHSVSKKIKSLTNLKEPDTWLAARFPKVMDQFYKWLGNQSFILCSWGEEDRKVLLHNLSFHQLSANKFQYYYNVQSAFSPLVNQQKGNQIGLMTAIKSLGLMFDGNPHRSIDDAYNTAKVLIKAHKQLSINPVPLIEKLELDIEYNNKVNELKKLRRKFNLHYEDLSLLVGRSKEELEQIESFQLTIKKKEIKRLVNSLYMFKNETLEKR
ncbi:exonuclease domain-containing protein [Caldibacillus lycopersici]|uniref:Exonuclease domain-containing protein n=1 Tax=Perspicuibacillus lycopersici TaxID=1325689 RepID=A0AAE3IWR0_9BACI|nr:3'-5' exonuclease [Perspicuibacillus lycopersici]MCU9615003.1 exonuclease domain-containing protein [Perspicuibacillus lycopersici]